MRKILTMWERKLSIEKLLQKLNSLPRSRKKRRGLKSVKDSISREEEEKHGVFSTTFLAKTEKKTPSQSLRKLKS